MDISVLYKLLLSSSSWVSKIKLTLKCTADAEMVLLSGAMRTPAWHSYGRSSPRSPVTITSLAMPRVWMTSWHDSSMSLGLRWDVSVVWGGVFYLYGVRHFTCVRWDVLPVWGEMFYLFGMRCFLCVRWDVLSMWVEMFYLFEVRCFSCVRWDVLPVWGEMFYLCEMKRLTCVRWDVLPVWDEVFYQCEMKCHTCVRLDVLPV